MPRGLGLPFYRLTLTVENQYKLYHFLQMRFFFSSAIEFQKLLFHWEGGGEALRHQETKMKMKMMKKNNNNTK